MKNELKAGHEWLSEINSQFGMFLSMLEYKYKWYGVNLVKIDRFIPSSKTCGK